MPLGYTRDGRTWVSYLVLLHYGYFLVSLGVVLPYLRHELHFGYGVASLHLSAFAAGSLLSAVAARRIELARGRLWLVGAGVVGASISALLLAAAPSPVATVACSFAMGAVAGWAIVGAQASLADRHPDHRATAITEAHLGASVGALLLPLAVGGAEAVVGWRGAIVAGAVGGAVLIVALRIVGVHGSLTSEGDAAAPSPPARLWLLLGALLLLVSAEGSLVFWGASFVDDEVGLSTRAAVACMSVYFAAGVAGRVGMSWLSRRVGAGRILAGALVLVIAAFPLLWLAHGAVMSVAGLFLLGLGMSACFPMAVSIAISTEPRAASVISARTVMAGSLAGIASPLILGPLGDAAGLMAAFGLIPVALLLAVAVLLAFQRTERAAAA
jgi:MFS family permease